MKVVLIGCGSMGSAMARRLALQHDLFLFDRDFHKATILAAQIGAKAVKELGQELLAADVVLLGIKPKDVEELAKAIENHLVPSTIVVSMLAGTSMKTLHRLFPRSFLLRIMPNLAVTYEKGVIGIVEFPEMSAKLRQEAEQLLQGMGLLVFVPENQIDALTALTGSAPAFVFDLIEAMMEGGIALGFPQEQALSLVLQVFDGAVALLKEGKEQPAVLKTKVASPGGTTVEGLKILEHNNVHNILVEALRASFNKAKHLSIPKSNE
jgi:pyrroline-5-carboxylate reductase